jgi:Zn ribbon nucleic-acid-binding protein
VLSFPCVPPQDGTQYWRRDKSDLEGEVNCGQKRGTDVQGTVRSPKVMKKHKKKVGKPAFNR